ncbi:MAG: HNH endonuclease [Bacteroidota bacterium]|nr:HNH endonuclease [Bacteroidota bacterium]
MEDNELLNQYKEERSCVYRDRTYLVRDNGAIFRVPKPDCRVSKLDGIWTFGNKDKVSGYMLWGQARVHQVVATAFHGPAPEPHMVVDHIDINRCNNRPENLRWLTRLENTLNNDATRKKIIYLCGSIEAFIEDPSILRTKALSTDVSWMKSVTKEEAAACKKHVEEWAARDSNHNSTGARIDNWIFSDDEYAAARKWNGDNLYSGYNSVNYQRSEIEADKQPITEADLGIKDSLTPGAKQRYWKTPTEFPQCPQEIRETPLQDYLARLTKGTIFCRNQYGESPVIDADLSEDGELIAVKTAIDGVTSFALCTITFAGKFFIHESIRTFFTEEGADKFYTEALGRKWEGGDVLEDYC